MQLAFRKGFAECGHESEKFVLDLFYFLKASPGRKEDYFDVQLGLQLDEEPFIKHVQSRWLTLIPAAARIIAQWEAVHTYFLEDLSHIANNSKTVNSMQSNNRYMRICSKLKDPVLLV